MSPLLFQMRFLMILTVNLKASVSTEASNSGVLNVACPVPFTGNWQGGKFSASAIILGINEIARRQILPGYQIKWMFRDDKCTDLIGMKVVMEMWSEVDHLHGIVGPPCSVIAQPVGLLAAAWEVPIISWASASPVLSDKSTYPTFSRVVGTWPSRAPAFNALADVFGWNIITILTTHEDLYSLTAKAIMAEMIANKKHVKLFVIKHIYKGNTVNYDQFNAFKNQIKGIKKTSRVFILLSLALDVRAMLVAALDLDMMNGEYAFIVAYNPNVDAGPFRPETDELIYNGLLVFTLASPSGPIWDSFRQDVIDTFQDPVFDSVPHLAQNSSIDSVINYAGFIHDAWLHWAYAVNRTLEQGYQPSEGAQVAKNMFNTNFHGITGEVYIDDIGNRKEDLLVIILQNDVPSGIQLLRWEAGITEMKKLYKHENEGDWSGLVWYSNASTVPLDRPLCGWNGELCKVQGSTQQYFVISVTSISVFLSVLLCVVTLGLVKKYKHDRDAEMSKVLIDWRHIVLQESNAKSTGLLDLNVNTENIVSRYSSFRKVKIAKLGEEYVALSLLGEKTVNLNDKEIMLELRNMIELNHSNVNTFIGICHLSPNVCYVMAYASKGTLQDLLYDEEISLIIDFKISFILDIARGMRYLHSSSLEVHGCLTSARCVVDNRWICKIAGYGLTRLKQKYSKKGDPYALSDNPAKVMWTAPERKKGPETFPVLKKADVYSFAIIMQEIFLKDVPYAANHPELEPEEIIDKVFSGLKPPYRPTIPEGTCSADWEQLMAMCWDEDPLKRPTFQGIVIFIIKHHKHKDIDLMTNIISRLEKHTHDLETRVEERHAELLVEKGKMELILSELLPQSVAKQLAKGQQMESEYFESVSVLITDIVGFTQISEAFTPMETVSILNNLYCLFDETLDHYGVYKVATIGDAYMVASGVPIRNGTKHGKEICDFAIELLASVKGQNNCLSIRVGIDSGPCVAGVVGIKMPRYLLFGHTVEIASKVEAAGKAMQIHITENTRCIIQDESHFDISENKETCVKGLENIRTYWLS